MRKSITFIFLLIASLNLLSQNQVFDVCPIKIGQEMPVDVTVQNPLGESVKFAQILESKKLIVVFYRGGWCPYCTRHLSALGMLKDEIDSLGFTLVGITPDRFDSLAVSQLKSESDYEIYSDSKAELIRAFGLAWEIDSATYVNYRDQYKMDLETWSGETHHLLPVPAVYLIVDGVIQFNYVNPNYKIRLRTETLLAILKSL